MTRLPKLTVFIILFCLFVFFSDANEWGMYDREKSSQLWRFILASFTHFDIYHLSTNLVVFAILASTFERSKSAGMLFLVILATVLSTTCLLHFYLPSYSRFAGISCVNFSILGYLLLVETRNNWRARLMLSSFVIFFEVVVMLANSSASWSTGNPVWQLHVLAFLIGTVFFISISSMGRGNAVLMNQALDSRRALWKS
jgi:membrane associated rhomboid family serine protease